MPSVGTLEAAEVVLLVVANVPACVELVVGTAVVDVVGLVELVTAVVGAVVGAVVDVVGLAEVVGAVVDAVGLVELVATVEALLVVVVYGGRLTSPL
jgi:hypothetical protein